MNSILLNLGGGLKKIWNKLKKNTRFLLGALILIFVMLFVFLMPLIYDYDVYSINLPDKLQSPFQSGLFKFLLGTDQMGRDFLSRLIYGTRLSLLIGTVTTTIAATIGTFIGMFAGYFGGRFGNLLMRATDIIMCYPFVIIAIIASAILQPGLSTIIIVFSAFGWTGYARIIYGVTLQIKETEFIEAARALGANPFRIILKHIFPNILPTLIVIATLQVRIMILAEATLSFLGIGIQPPTPSLGVIIGIGRNYFSTAWWIGVLPGIVLIFIVLGFNLLGDGLNDLLNPENS